MDALGNTEHYAYDKKGQLLEKLDKEGYLTRYGYTAHGDVNHITYADGREVKLSYNSLRQLEEMEDWLGITRIENDPMGRALKVQYPDGKEVSYTYGKGEERTSITYPDGRTASYIYDSRLKLAGLKDGEEAITYGYDERGRLSRKTFPNGMETSYAYDIKGQLMELTHRDKEGILDRYAYGYDLTGNKTTIEKQRRGLPEESGAYAYEYDAMGRLAGVSRDGQPLRIYEYDAFGNRSLLKEGGRETAYAYNAMNQLIKKTDAMNEEAYAYDKRGNLSLILENGDIKDRYLYGALNRLEQAVNGKGEVAAYTYNGLGHRVGKMTGAMEGTAWMQDGTGSGILKGTDMMDPLSRLKEQTIRPETRIEYTIDLTRQYHNLLQKEEARNIQSYLWDGNVAGMREETGRESCYYLQDELGSPIRLMDRNGELAESYGYDEFGKNLYGNREGTAGRSMAGSIQPFGYTGYQYDKTAGTYYAQAREYRAEMGRFISEDWIKGNIRVPVNFNLYNYCWNSPLNYVDRNGKKGYYFFSDIFDDRNAEEDVDSDIARLEERFNCEVVKCPITNEGDFKDYWEAMDDDVDFVIVYTHASESSFGFTKPNGSREDEYHLTSDELPELGDKNIDYFITIGCNAGGVKNEICMADELLNNIPGISYVVAADRTVWHGMQNGTHTIKAQTYSGDMSIRDWFRNLGNSVIFNRGFKVFSRDDVSIYIGRSFKGVDDLLDAAMFATNPNPFCEGLE